VRCAGVARKSSGAREKRCNSPEMHPASHQIRYVSRRSAVKIFSRTVPISRSTNGCETGAYGTD